jgi:hypothetical protein
MGDRMTHMTVPIQRSDFGYLDVTVSDRQRLEATMIAETEKMQARAYLLRIGAEDDLFKALGLESNGSES